MEYICKFKVTEIDTNRLQEEHKPVRTHRTASATTSTLGPYYLLTSAVASLSHIRHILLLVTGALYFRDH